MAIHEAGYEYVLQETYLHIQINKSKMTRQQTIKRETEETGSEQPPPYTVIVGELPE